jgi:ABC-type dipeptide/oligopeptide/nickel transport system permease component
MPTLRAPAMLKQIGRRLATVIPSLIGVIIVTFLLTRVLPGDTAAYFADRPPLLRRLKKGASSRSRCRCPSSPSSRH